MKLNIDHLDDLTGWILNAPSSIEELTRKAVIAGYNTKSLMINFDQTDTIRTATKTFSTPFDVTNYESLIFSIWSQNYGSNKRYMKPSDFSYKIDIDGVKEFYIPVYSTFSDIVIGIEDVTEINQIKITPLHPDTDSIIISEMIAEKEEIPLDVLQATKEAIDYYTEDEKGKGLLIGSVTALVGDNSITLSNPDYVDRYSVLLIDDGVNSEIHQIEKNDSNTYFLNSNFDGGLIQNNFTNASVYLTFPSFINPGQFEIRLPGFSIWGITPEPVLRGGKLDILRDTWEASGVSKQRVEGQIYKYTILITCESRSQELIDIMTRIVRRFIGRESLWINGRRHDVAFSGNPVELPLGSTGIDYFPQVQYSFEVEVKENINDRISMPVTTTINTEINIVEEI